MPESANKTQSDSPFSARQAVNRSAVTNGKRNFLTKGGELSVYGRRWRDVFECVVMDRGGPERLSEGQRQLCRRVATLSVEAEAMEAQRADGGELDLEAYVSLTNALGRVLSRLGISRAKFDVTPDLQGYISDKTGDSS